MMIKASALCLLSALIVQSVSFVCSCSLLSLARPWSLCRSKVAMGEISLCFAGVGNYFYWSL
jgi:hypothetical protein